MERNENKKVICPRCKSENDFGVAECLNCGQRFKYDGILPTSEQPEQVDQTGAKTKAENKPVSNSGSEGNKSLLRGIFIAIAFILIAVGAYFLFTSDPIEIYGGDAYNGIISNIRGAVFVISGFLSGIIACIVK